MDKKAYIDYHQAATEKMSTITKAKNADYTGTSDDPFANFRRSEALGICDMERGILVRITDKLARLISFAQRGTFAVADESFEDTCLDLANYAIILAAANWERKASAFEQEQTTPLTTVANRVAVGYETYVVGSGGAPSPSTKAAQGRAP